MESNNFIYNDLKFVSFSKLTNWSVQYIINNTFNYNKKYPLIEIGDFLIRNKTLIEIKDNIEYKRVTIKVNNGGVYLRDIEKGIKIGTKKQYIITEGQFLLSKIDARNGAFGVVPVETNKAIITGNFWTFDIDYSKIHPHYLSLIVTTPEFINFCQKASNGTTNRHYLQEKLFLEVKIPLPSLKEQNRLVENYVKKIKVAEEQEQKAGQLEHEIENYLLEELGVEKQKEEKKQLGKLIFGQFKGILEWGVDKILRGNQEILKSKKYPNKKLSDYFFINPRTNLDQLNDNDEMSFIPMDCISDIYGEVIKIKEGKKKNSSGYTKFQENDLIWARITPCMQNGKSAIVKGLKNRLGYGSTEYHVIRKKSNDIILDFIYNILRTELIRGDAVNYFTGSAGQQRVPKSYLENLKIPLPPLEKQIEIVAYITNLKNKIKKLHILAKKNREEAIREFEQEIFNS